MHPPPVSFCLYRVLVVHVHVCVRESNEQRFLVFLLAPGVRHGEGLLEPRGEAPRERGGRGQPQPHRRKRHRDGETQQFITGHAMLGVTLHDIT